MYQVMTIGSLYSDVFAIWIDAKMESWIFIRLNANALICLFSEHVSSYLVDQVGDITNLA